MHFRLLRKLFSHLKLFLRKRKSRFVYVALGDSSVEGVGASSPEKSFPAIVFNKLKKDHPNAEFHNLGRRGARVKNVVAEQLPRALELNPNLVTISIGVNDICGRIKVKHFEKDLKYLIETLKTETGAKIVINNLPDFSFLPITPLFLKISAKIFIKKFNSVIEKISKEFKLVMVDIYKESKVYGKRWKEFICEDGFHPSDAGYTLWASTILNSIT